jgi:hypothetical protein
LVIKLTPALIILGLITVFIYGIFTVAVPDKGDDCFGQPGEAFGLFRLGVRLNQLQVAVQ